jgi:hypothetical protein
MAEPATILDQIRTLAERAIARVESGRLLPPRLLDVDDAGRYLSMSDKGVRNLITNGELAYVQRIAGRSPYLIDIRDLDAWIAKNKIRAGE